MNAFLQKVYAMSPVILQELALNSYAAKIHGERFGRRFERELAYWNQTQWLSYDELIQLQNEKLRVLVKYAFQNVPYYREIMNSLRLTPEDFKTVNDLHKLPVLSRDQVKIDTERLISSLINRRELAKGHTSGTTGSPLQFYWDRNMCLINNVADWRQKNWAGVELGDKYAVLLGRMIVPIRQQEPPFWRTNHLHRQLWLSCFHMSERNLKCYMKKLEEFRPVALEGYPSSIFILAKYLESRGRQFPLRAVFTSSETLHNVQRETIEKAFACGVFDFYGLAERTVFAGECAKHEGRHVNMEYGVLEIVNDKGEAVERGSMGKIVGTSLHNFGMPFIRYATADVSAVLAKECSCGRALPLLSDVTTKADDIVVTKDGRFIPPSGLTHPFKALHNIRLSQIIQEDTGRLIVKIVPDLGYSMADTDQLVSALKERLGWDMKIEIELVESIPLTPMGKFRWVISKVPLKL